MDMWENLGYYEILGVTATATAAEIKRAYFTTVRKYPPERFPEEFKRIKEVYGILGNPETRRLYDTGEQNPECRKYLELADQAYDRDDYDTALAYLQKALQITAENRTARNLTGLCYLCMDLTDKAIPIFKKLTYEFPDDAAYFGNLGDALLQTKAYKQALEAFEKSLRLDPDDIYTWNVMSTCYSYLGKRSQARQIVEDGLRHCGPDLNAYLRLIMLDSVADDLNLVRNDIARLIKMTKNDPEMRDNLAWALVEAAGVLIENDHTELAAELMKKAKQLNPDREIKSMASALAKQNKFVQSLDLFHDDPAIHPWLKEWVEGTAAEKQNDPLFALHLDTMYRLLMRQPAHVLNSAERIRNHYPEIFRTHKKFFQTLLNHPEGSPVGEVKLLEDLKNLARKAGGCSDALAFGLTLDDFAVPPMQRTAPAKVGRNDPCPCGSGKKYKKCCMANS